MKTKKIIFPNGKGVVLIDSRLAAVTMAKAEGKAKLISHVSNDIITKILDGEEISNADMILYMHSINSMADDLYFGIEHLQQEL